MRAVMIILLGMLGSASALADAATEALMVSRLESFQGMTRLLIGHNPDLRGLARSEQSHSLQPIYQRLMSQAPAAVVGAMNAQMQVIEEQLQALEVLAVEREALVPGSINEILAAHHRIDRLLTSEMGTQPGGTGPHIDQLSLSVAQIGLLYQTRLFNGLMVHADNPEGDVMAELDERIMADFEQLQTAGLGEQPLFQRSQRNYRFVRASLLGEQENWVPDAVEFYLSDVMRNLIALRQEVK